jgi:hypothetical protein
MRYNPPVYKHRKSGKLYWRLASGIFKNGGTSFEDMDCVVYCPCDDESSIYVRLSGDWENGFEEVGVQE